MATKPKKKPAAKKAQPKRKTKARKGKHPGGRPTKYRAEFVAQATKLCELGATDTELADFFGIEVRTLYRWQLEYPEFCQALRSGKDAADERVARSLYHKAIGYSYEGEKVQVLASGKVVRIKTREYVPPSDTAIIFWLKNRRRGDWRDRHELTGANGGPIQHVDLSNLGDADLDALEAIAERLARPDANPSGEKTPGTGS